MTTWLFVRENSHVPVIETGPRPRLQLKSPLLRPRPKSLRLPLPLKNLLLWLKSLRLRPRPKSPLLLLRLKSPRPWLTMLLQPKSPLL